MWPCSQRQIHTSFQAGGIPRLRTRSRTSGSSIGRPSSSRYVKPRPRRARRNPGLEQSARRRRTITWVSPVARPFRLSVAVAPLAFHTTPASGGDALISLTGELDLSGAAPLEEEIERLAEQDGVRRVVLDLRKLEFMDSSGLRLVALAERRLGGAGRALVLVRGPEAVQRVFEITRMEDHLTFVDEPDGDGETA